MFTPSDDPWELDARHANLMLAVLQAARYDRAAELGSYRGYSARALVEAKRTNNVGVVDLVEPNPRPELVRLANDNTRVMLYEMKSVDYLAKCGSLDFVFVDGDHTLPTVREEVEHLMCLRPKLVVAHDTNSEASGIHACPGPAYLKCRFQTQPDYRCLEENARRKGELTHRGLFLATTDPDIFRAIQAAIREWGAVG